MLEYLSVGQIVNVHGFKGEVKVYPLSNDIERFKQLKQVYVEKGEELNSYEVQSIKYLKNTVVLKLKGVDTEEQANSLRNCYVKVERQKAVKLPKDNFFICDLIECEVHDINGVLLGTIIDVMQTGSNDVFVVKKGNKEILIPALKSIVKEVNIEDRKIKVELPEGLM